MKNYLSMVEYVFIIIIRIMLSLYCVAKYVNLNIEEGSW